MTALLHRLPDADAFERRLQAAELAHLAASPAAAAALAEGYLGLPG
jgi:p-hydroxybenzoate 3-monooxygenase